MCSFRIACREKLSPHVSQVAPADFADAEHQLRGALMHHNRPTRTEVVTATFTVALFVVAVLDLLR